MSLPVLDSLSQIADQYDGFILDLWGVIHDGTQPMTGPPTPCASSPSWARKR